MKINELYIDGFGHFHDYPVKELSPGLTIIKGPNEAGKSTLLAFIRRMLFGKPPGRSYNPYEPLNGGEHGGRLNVELDQGEVYNISRYISSDKCELSDNDGNIINKKIESIIGSADQHFYDNIFAFGLEELYKFETLSDESIQNHVTGAGVGIKTCSIPSLQKTIKDDIQGLYKSRGQKPLINKTLKDISEIEKELKQFSRTQEEFDRSQRKKREEEEDLNSLKEKKKEISQKLEHWKIIHGIWDEWSDYQENLRQLSELPSIDSFPEDGFHKLEKYQEKIEERREGKEEKEQQLQDLKGNLNSISLNNSVLECETEIHELERGLEKYLSDIESKDNLTSEIKESEEQFRRDISLINQGWNKETLLSFDYSPGVKSNVINLRDSFNRTEEKIRDLSKEIQSLEDGKNKINPELDVIKQNLEESNNLRSEKELQDIKEGINELYSETPVLQQKKNELESIQRDEASESRRWEERKAVLSSRMPVWPAALIIFAGILSLGYGTLNNSPAIGLGLLVIFGIIAAIYYLTAKKHQKQQDMAFDFDTSTSSEEKVLHLSTIRRQKQSEVSELEKKLNALANKCGFDGLPGTGVLSIKRDEIEKELAAVNDRRRKEEQKGRLEGQIATTDSEIEKKKQDIQSAEFEKSKFKSEWNAWLKGVSLDENLVPDVVLDLFPKIEKQAGIYSSLISDKDKLQELSNSVKEYESKTGHLISQCNLESSGSTNNDVEALAKCLKQNSDNQNEISSINKSSEKLGDDIEQLKSEIGSFESDIQKLFEAGSAENEENFRSNGKVWEKRDELNKALDANRKNISRVAGKGVVFEDFTKQLESLDLSEINGNIRVLEETLDEVESDIDDKNTNLGQITEVIKQLNSEDEFTLLESQRLLLLENLHEKSREWAKRVIAGYLLQKAVEKYEEERQPAVIQEAKSIFSDISGGRYPNIIKPLESDIMVEEINGKRKTVAQLSRGTAEQLYLALRFGYINEYGKHDVRLPVVFDDILVNFDPDRKEKSCKAIAQLADNNQILYFTCHPETAVMLKENRPDAVVVDLG